ncbi:hypothetical protein [Clostridium estertheticum]|uniref:hypothetical protein n=1 Tax=Clostridium estertheticum TaxID=238834 RepID=UPI001CF10B8F|nr:hypothetical protein [Clostridium estertheticum]MCB2342608.1 hypothetical protein [Clostridium estertheticum]
MKHKTILPILLIFSIFLTSCGDFNSIKKNQLVVEKIGKKVTATSNIVNDKKILTEEEAKLKTLEYIEKYFNVKLYLSEIESNVSFISSSMVKKDSSLITQSSYSKIQLKYSNSVLENGLYSVEFFTKAVKQAQDINSTYFSVKIDAKTGECIEFNSYYKDFYGKPSLKNSIDINGAKIIAKGFILKNNIGNIKNVKFLYQIVGYQESYNLVFEDNDAGAKKVMIYIDRNTKKVFGFSIGR